ncbi:PH-like domain-containing protein [Microbacterium sp. GXF7504]
MTREGALVLMLVLAVALVGLMAWGWWRRSRRDAGLTAPVGDIPAGAKVLAAFPGLYVATTVHDVALERLAVKGLGFRSRVTVTVTDAGVALDLQGEERVFVPADRLTGVDQATVAIDRVVERDGLTRLSWRIADDTVVDSFFRPQDASARALAAAIEPLVSTASPTGTNA